MENSLVQALINPVKTLDTIVAQETVNPQTSTFSSALAKRALCAVAVSNDIIHGLLNLSWCFLGSF